MKIPSTAEESRNSKSTTEKVEKLDPKGIIEYFLPHLITAGDYALQVQPRVYSQRDKVAEYSQALTDADLSIQNMIEVATLAKFPEFSVDLEEVSLNLKYFPSNSDVLLSVDPINGTNFYKNNLPIFDIILSILKKGDIVAAVTYIPARGVFYIGLKGQGAFKTTKEDVRQNKPWREHQLQPHSNTTLTHRCSEDIRRRLKEVMEIKDRGDYDPNNWRLSAFSILDGDIDAYVKYLAPTRDWGAIGFIAKEAGGTMSDVSGQPIPKYLDFRDKKIPDIVVSASQEIHDRIIAALNKNETA